MSLNGISLLDFPFNVHLSSGLLIIYVSELLQDRMAILDETLVSIKDILVAAIDKAADICHLRFRDDDTLVDLVGGVIC